MQRPCAHFFAPVNEVQRLQCLRLSRETSVLPSLAISLLNHFGGDWAAAGAPALCDAGVPQAAAERLAHPAGLDEAQQLLKACDERGIGWMIWKDPGYPQALAECPDPPLVLYWRGRAPEPAQRNLAIVGTRKASGYGKRMTATVVEELAPLQPLIISGMAYGIDIAAHRAALDNGMLTWGVLAQGLDTLYPSLHGPDAMRILESGGSLLSEFPPGVPSRAWHFPRRNRIVAGLADALLVVESGPGGGSLITAGIALSYHREVFALPGPVDRESSRGCHRLIREHGAALVTGGRDLAEAMNWVPGAAAQGLLWTSLSAAERLKRYLPPGLSEMQPVLLWLMEEGPLHQEELLARTRWSPAYLSARLLEAEFSGWLSWRPGGYVAARLPSA